MKVKVLKKFKDKYNGKVYKVDSVINVSEERFEEILKVDKLVEKVEEPKKEKEKKNAEK